MAVDGTDTYKLDEKNAEFIGDTDGDIVDVSRVDGEPHEDKERDV